MTWRESQDWGRKLGYSSEQIADFNRMGIELLQDVRSEYEGVVSLMVISGCIGPRGDDYSTDIAMTANEAEAYHHTQIATFRETEADMVAAFTIPYIAEGIGVALTARSEEMSVVISFTVETDGRLPSGEMLKDTIEKVDAATDNTPVYYMINCAHTMHFINVLREGEWTKRIRAIRANSSTKSHAELNNSGELDEGNPDELSSSYLDLLMNLENLNVIGGCCGTDHRHVMEICKMFVNKTVQNEK
jgi:S-methylmethionine-dependent homocysteine/selenocysteine methylase